MLPRLFSLLLLAAVATTSYAQKNTKSTQNTPLANIDHKQPGTPMPPLVFMAYNDTTAENATPPVKEKKRKRKTTTVSDSSLYSVVTDKDLDNNANLLVMLFNPTCSHCEEMTFMLEKNIDAFKRSKLVLLATKPMEPYLADYAQRHHVARYPAMYIGYDTTKFIDEMFLYQTLPQINIFDRDRKLLKIFAGEVPADSLKKFIE